jgi:hypothetical protein
VKKIKSDRDRYKHHEELKEELKERRLKFTITALLPSGGVLH